MFKSRRQGLSPQARGSCPDEDQRGMWASRMRINREKTIPYIFRKCEENGRLDNFAIAGGLKTGEQQGIYPFDDTDVYKILEAASCALTGRNDRTMEVYMDSVIVLIAGAQEEDGYLYTARTNKSERLRRWFGNERWEKLNGAMNSTTQGIFMRLLLPIFWPQAKGIFLMLH